MASLKKQPEKSFVLPLLLPAVLILMLLLFLLPGCGKSTPSSTSPSTTTSEKNVDTSLTTVAAPENLTVLSITGDGVQVQKHGTAEWKRGEEGMTLEVGDRIKTQAGGRATITFFEGSIIELGYSTEVAIVELGATDRNTSVRLRQEIGNTYSRVEKLLDPADRYEIETPAAVVAVRGSIAYVDVALSGATFAANIKGKVAVIARGVEIELPVDTHTNVTPGEPPTPPEPGTTPPPIITTSTSTTTSPTSTATFTSTATPTSSATTSTSVSTTTLSTTTTTTSTTTSTSTSTLPPLTIRITSLNPGDQIEQSQMITITGEVSDPSITEATLTVNGVSGVIPVVGGQFSTLATLTMGINNTITVSVTRDGVTAMDGRELILEVAPGQK